ncbi:hypothetical protein [Sporolactobacillus inulinus]|uniref:Uncharacterized protein n=1 Tax=Sporolactobacillus inulinus TaxID=2078 RepID=A0A4Y1ZFT1_9BACL|nr:hypothetical protein [Sporolactobacillus inulinus]GAY78032.1 hypothetical protein NBRC111894_3586 [Sporolactobacillus inulinus]GEB76281.1 hypothetical protein SIN01_06260 [Sporolactobacillus inulinus]
MHEHQFYLEEKQKIDTLLGNEFRIVAINENLSGMFVAFKQMGDQGNTAHATLHLLIPETRKYVTNLLLAEKVDQSPT